jgi:hypothetical protein
VNRVGQWSAHILTLCTSQCGPWLQNFRHSLHQSYYNGNIDTLKGQSHDIFDIWFFFRETVPLGSLIHGLKRFCI